MRTARRRWSTATDHRPSTRAAANPGAAGGPTGLRFGRRRRGRSTGRADPTGWRARARASLRYVGNRLWTLRQNGQSGASAGGSQAVPNALGEVADWLEPGRPNLRVRQSVGLEKYLRLALDLGLDLDLPLVVDRKPRFEQPDHEGVGVDAGAQQVFVPTVFGHAVRALAGDDDAAAGLDDLGGSTHAFDGLVQVLVEWIAAVGGQDDVVRGRHGCHRRRAGKKAARGVAGEQIARKHVGDRVVAIQRHVQIE